ncbi:MAG: phytanoyl-CoA dioxygenase family protein [Pseudomonadota bacterium]
MTKVQVKLKQQKNLSGDPTLATQGFGKISTTRPPMFDPAQAHDAAYDFFSEHGFAVLSECLDDSELAHLNEFYDRTQEERPASWGFTEKRKPHHRGQGLIFSQPLLDYPELDKYTQHPRSYPVVARILGGEERVRFSELNFREAPLNAGVGAMNFHHDAITQDRFDRKPYMPCDWLCAIHYLTDVDETTPAFCVVPKSNQYPTLKEAYEGLGDDYQEMPIYGPAGTCVLYDTGLFHTRLDGDGKKMRRTWHQYYARGGWLKSSLPTTNKYVRPPSPPLTNWNLFPERLVMHPDPKIKMFFSHWNTAQCEWVASGFDPEVRKSMPRGEQ